MNIIQRTIMNISYARAKWAYEFVSARAESLSAQDKRIFILEAAKAANVTGSGRKLFFARLYRKLTYRIGWVVAITNKSHIHSYIASQAIMAALEKLAEQIVQGALGGSKGKG